LSVRLQQLGTRLMQSPDPPTTRQDRSIYPAPAPGLRRRTPPRCTRQTSSRRRCRPPTPPSPQATTVSGAGSSRGSLGRRGERREGQCMVGSCVPQLGAAA
jgi:hypothetical protein